MARYGYKRMTVALAELFHRRTYFFHLQTYARDYVECPVENIKIDGMVIFRAI